MKGFSRACLLALLQVTVAQAYESDIHYSTTYVLARAVGWSEADARTIASANQGLDENQHTVAALEMDSVSGQSFAGYVTSSLHQADQNLRFHCFSATAGNLLSADVLEVISERFAEVPARVDGPQRKARRLIALGTALHCLQDAHSHVGFGGTCGAYPGSCLGHTHETFLDQLVFGVLKKHYFNPDHPGVSGERLLAALEGTARKLAAHLPTGSSRPIPTQELVALAAALRGSGLELPDDVRRDCNRQIAGKWLFDHFRSGRRTRARHDAVEMLAPGVAGTCRNTSLGSASIVSIPDARFPRLNADASPYLVRADGSYQLMRDGDYHVSLPGIHAEGAAALIPDYTRKVKVRLSHWRQLFALPLITRVALLPADSNAR